MAVINGNYSDFSCIELAVNGILFGGIQSIEYTESVEKATVYGSSSKPLGFTRGQYSLEGSFEMIQSEYVRLRQAVPYLLDAVLSASVSYEVPGELLVTDEIVGIRITEIGNSHSVGSDALVVSLSFSALEIKHNKASAMAEDDLVAAALGLGLAGAGAVTSLI